MQPTETPNPQPTPAPATAPPTPQPPAPAAAAPQPAGNIMDVVPIAAPQTDEVAQEPVYEDDEQPNQPAEPAKPNSTLPTLPTKEEQAANAPANQPKIPSNKTPGVGLAIAATTIIVITLAVLAFLAYVKQS